MPPIDLTETANMQHFPFREDPSFIPRDVQEQIIPNLERIPESYLGFQTHSCDYLREILDSDIAGVILLEKQVYFKGFRHSKFDIKTDIPVLELGLVYSNHETNLRSLRIVIPPMHAMKMMVAHDGESLTSSDLVFGEEFVNQYIQSLQMIPGFSIQLCIPDRPLGYEPQVPTNGNIELLENKLDDIKEHKVSSVPALISQDAEQFANTFLV